MEAKVLLVEDEASLALIVAETLRGEGFEVTVAGDGAEALDICRSVMPDIVVADVMMPRMDGFEMGRRMRKISPDVPLLFLTARSSIEDIVEGFELGANDYLKKPFKMQELIVRMKALLRRYIPDGTADGGCCMELGLYRFDPVAQTLSRGDEVIALSHFESLILGVLVRNVNNPVDSSTLMLTVWQRDDVYNRNSLHGFIHKLRRHLRHDPSISIINLRGIGYKLTVVR